ncbi:MAG: hypothetical protein LQ343_000290 [Gyalolechia ehrenbergii]|nr:MAG: hypothetical protein LQ343_000290 [Gyalolechia ehrenbergii]
MQWVWTETGKEAVAPQFTYYALRVLMFILSFVLEDWAIHDLIQSPRERRLALLLTSSSYITWTYQTHTFSSALETLIVLWSLVMTQRILNDKYRSALLSSAALGSLMAFGVFNRITFPAFILPPGVYLLFHFSRKPLSFLTLGTAFLLTTTVAIAVDTSFYNDSAGSFFHLLRTNPIITPLNSLLYNTSSSNLSIHGLHPPYQHFIASLPLLLGPALLLLWNIRKPTLPILSVLSATLLLSLIPHQEPRFLLPAVPLVLSSVRLPKAKVLRRYWLVSWVIFNAVLGVLMGVYHQGGVVPAQLWLGQQQQQHLGFTEVFWWRTYSPPVWLLGGKEIMTIDLMGTKAQEMMKRVSEAVGSCSDRGPRTAGLVAPWSSVELDIWMKDSRAPLSFEKLWMSNYHLNLDDLDVEEDGIRGMVERLVGRRGLVVWKIRRLCEDTT